MPGRYSGPRGGVVGAGAGAGPGVNNTSDKVHPRDAQDSNPTLSPESLSIAQLRKTTIAHPMQQCQLSIYVPTHTVGAVIGRGGRTILSVQREAMRRSAGHAAPIRISVLGTGGSGSNANTTPDSQQGGQWNPNQNLQQQKLNNEQNDDNTEDSTNNDDDWTPVIIRGDPVGCFAAVRQLLPLVEYDHDPDIVLEVPIHKAKHNLLVGKGGITIAALSATYETRIMIPPNELMSNVGGGENVWKQRQQAHQTHDAGSMALFGKVSNTGGTGSSNQNLNATGTGSLPPQIIQLEGDVDNVEQCLVKMLNIVAGERWVPTGVIVEMAEVNDKQAQKAGPPSTTSSGKGKDTEPTAEAVLIKIWSPDSKLLNLQKIRKVQRKTNTIIRRKKLRISGSNITDGYSGEALVNEKEEDAGDEEAAEPPLTSDDNDEEDEVPTGEAKGPKTATKYIITGKPESVKSAAAQFEKILGLEPGSAKISEKIKTTSDTDGKPEEGEKKAWKKRPKKRGGGRGGGNKPRADPQSVERGGDV